MTATTVYLNSEEKALLDRIAEELGLGSRHALMKMVIRCIISRYLREGAGGVRSFLNSGRSDLD